MAKAKEMKLSFEEKQLLKEEIKKSWDELPLELKEFYLETKREKLRALYMLQDWAKKNNHETMLDLLSRKIAHKEEKLQQMQDSLKK